MSKEMRYEDVFMLQKVSSADVSNFNYVAGTVPLIRKIVLDVRSATVSVGLSDNNAV